MEKTNIQAHLEGHTGEYVGELMEDTLAILENQAGESVEELKGLMEDVMEHGLVSGCIGSLIYYKDTHAFTMKHWDDIQDIIHEVEEQTDAPFIIPEGTQWSNYLAWYAFEYATGVLYSEIDWEELEEAENADIGDDDLEELEDDE